MKAIASARITRQISDIDYETFTEVLPLEPDEPVSRIQEWAESLKSNPCNRGELSSITIQFIEK